VDSRRAFFGGICKVGAGAALLAGQSAAQSAPPPASRHASERVSLDGIWQFRLDSESDWREVGVPHTWQINPASADYMGIAWYRREFDIPREWEGGSVRLEFEAVFHSARVSLNGQRAGEHLRKGYTAFTIDIARALQFGRKNQIEVRVDNSFNAHMLPRNRSSDWSPDGGIYRPVTLLIAPKAFIERADIEAVPNLAANNASLAITVALRNTGEAQFEGHLGYRVVEEASGNTILEIRRAIAVSLKPGAIDEITLPTATLPNPKLWHFDNPNLYTLVVELESQREPHHSFFTNFGVRGVEIKDGGFYLNGERVYLMGVERMAGSNPQYGMAEPSSWIAHDHDDLKHLNCVFTRVHWQQDKRVLDYCDRHGIFIQEEIPAWGPDTFKGMTGEPSQDIVENGLEQLRETIHRDRNHPSIFSWGLCNEINGQNPPAYQFAKRMYEEAKKFDPRRPCSYASHSLRATPERDVAGLMDFIECNEYFGSWYKGDAAEVGRSMDSIHSAFPDKPIVISEYGYCACTADRPEGDARRLDILETHDAVFRERPYIAGLIFFCYNDYRTHVGDKGYGVLKQRVHGVVDLLGERKGTYDALRRQSSPIELLQIDGSPGEMTVLVRSRKTIPCYTLTGYKLRWTVYGPGTIPLEQHAANLPALHPGQDARVPVPFTEPNPQRIVFDVLRPTGFSALGREWTA